MNASKQPERQQTSRGQVPRVVIAGAAGDLGGRITQALVHRGAHVVALVRPAAGRAALSRLADAGAETRVADPLDVEALTAALNGASCAVSVLNGLNDVILGRQAVLLEAVAQAGVGRFISSDFSADFSRSTATSNRNLNLRRQFKVLADRAPVAVTSILNGAFMELLSGDMPLIQPRMRRVLYWGDMNQVLNFTAKDDVAAYAAEAAMDQATPRTLRVAGDSLSVRDLARVLSEFTGQKYRPLKAGNLRSLDVLIASTKRLAPGRGEVFPAWQGMQYTRDMFSGEVQLHPTDNSRYASVTWTSVRDLIARDPRFASSRA